MAKQSIDIGTTANDDTGDTLRAGGDKINDNFTELYAHAEDTDNPHEVDKSDVNLSNLVNSLQVINAGSFKSIQVGTIGARPSASEADRYYYASDIHKLFRDDGSNWNLESLVATTNKDSNYSATINDFYIGITTVPHTLSLPASANIPNGFRLVVKDETGQAHVDNITINADGSDEIDGLSSFTLDEISQAVTLLLRGANWNIIGEYHFNPPS